MNRNLNRKSGYRIGRLLLCLLFTVIIVSQWAATVCFAAGVQAMNTSGSVNRTLSVDPIRKSEGFSAVLYNNRNGLPTSEANAIAQTDDGFLWIGSYAGLIRYDGNTFERIDSTTGIANVRCLFVDSRDRLWIGTNDSGVFLMTKGELQKWDRADGLRSESIRSIAEDENGLIYIGSAAGGVVMIDAEMKLTVLPDERLEGESVPDLRPGCDGLIYGFTSSGDLFTLKDGALSFFLSSDECRIKGIHSILPDPANPGRLYVGTSGSEICYGDLATNFATMGIKDISPYSYVNSMEYFNGDIWICTANGIGKIDSEGFRRLRNVPMSNSVEHVMTDYEGNLWFVSSHQGVMKIVRTQFSDLFERYDLPAAVVNSTCMYGRQLFIGTDDGLIVMEGDKKVDSIPLSKAVTASGTELEATDLLEFLDGVRIRCITRDSKGRLWIPTWRKYGILCYDQGELTVFSQEDGLFSDSIRIAYECDDGSILVSNMGGVSVIQDDRVTAGYGEEHGIVNSDILTLTEGFNHEMILGSDGDGIYIISPEGTKRIGKEDGLQSEIILRIKRSDSQNVYWIITGNSLAFMTPDYKVTTIRQFPYPNNFDLYENKAGDVWILSSNGIYVASVEELLANEAVDPVFYGMQNGLSCVATSNSLSELASDGNLYIAGSAGVVKVNIEKPFSNISETKITLPYIVADGERYYMNETDKFSLPANAQKVTFYPFVFNYSLIDPNVSYRLEGFDQTETTVKRSELTSLDYTNLKIGTYNFVMTVKDPVVHSEQTVSFQIVKGKEMSIGTIGTIILLFASILLMGGLLFYTSLYRKRGRLEDRLFFYLILVNIALTAGALLSYLLEYSSVPLARYLMILGNTVYYVALVFFAYLLFVYFDYNSDPEKTRMRKRKLLYGIPCVLMILLMIVNLKTGWIFSVDEGNAFHPGPHRLQLLVAIPELFYLMLSLIKVYRVNRRLTALGILLILARAILEIWCPSISSVSFIYTLFLVCIHLYVMNQPLYEEAS